MRLTEEEKDTLALCSQSTGVFCKTFMPKRFSRPYDPPHRRTFGIIDKRPKNPTYKPYKSIAGFRGLGKSSILGYGLPAKKALFQESHYIYYIAASLDMAIEKTEALKRFFERSDLVKYYFGDVKTKTWTKQQYVVKIGSHEVLIKPRGADQKQRGALFGDHRPDLILCDDLDDPTTLENEDQRVKRKKRFFSEVLNLVDRGADRGKWEIIFIANVNHQDSLVVNLHESKQWDSIVLPLCSENFESYAPNFLTDKECKSLYEHFKDQHEVDVWFREYLCNPVPQGEDAAFQTKFFKYYDEGEENLYNPMRNLWTVITWDPSRSSKPSSNPSGIVLWTIDLDKRKVFVRDVRMGYYEPEEQYEIIAELLRQYKADALGIEVTGLHEFVLHPIKTYLHSQGLYPNIIELHARRGDNERGKKQRVRQLIPWYRQGLVYHNESVCGPLEQQLLSFPNAREWCLMDPFGYINEVLEQGELYLSPGYDEYAYDPDVIKAEYEELEDQYSKPLEGFRILE